MSNYQLLEQCPCGYIGHCSCCGTFQVVFGNLALLQDEREYLELMEVLGEICLTNEDTDKPHLRSIFVKTTTEGLQFLFCLNELKRFHGMMQAAFLLYEANKIIES